MTAGVLEGVERTIIDGAGVRREEYKTAAWESWVNDDLINLVIINPQFMSPVEPLQQYPGVKIEFTKHGNL